MATNSKTVNTIEILGTKSEENHQGWIQIEPGVFTPGPQFIKSFREYYQEHHEEIRLYLTSELGKI